MIFSMKYLNHSPKRVIAGVYKSFVKNKISFFIEKQAYLFGSNTKNPDPKISNLEEKPKQKKKILKRDLSQYKQLDNQSHRLAPVKPQNQQLSIETLQFFKLQKQNKLEIIQNLKEDEDVYQLSMIAKQMLFQPQNSDTQVIWYALQEAFVSSLKPTKDSNKIRSISKFLYALGKSKRATRNYQTQMALLLPFSSHQSFTQIVTAVSRMGGMSQEFGHIVQKLYWQRKQRFSKLQMSLINYVLAKNGKKVDPQLIDNINSFPMQNIVMMLKAYDMADMMSPQILQKCIPAIVARKAETNLLDLRGIINIYSKYLYLDNEKLLNYINDQYRILARNVNQQAVQQIWEYFPQAVNVNKFPITFVEQVIKSLKILRTRDRISQRTWKKISITFGKFENLEIRTQLQKI